MGLFMVSFIWMILFLSGVLVVVPVGFITIGVPVEVLLSMTIRWLAAAGGAYVDIADLHGVSETCFWNMLPPLMESIANLEGITPAFAIKDEAALQEIADGFAKLIPIVEHEAGVRSKKGAALIHFA